MKSLSILGNVLCLLALLPAATVLAAPPDGDLQAGFPLQSYQTPDAYGDGPAIATLVANLDADPQLEIAVSAVAAGHIYLWNHDTSLVAGWPARSPMGLG